MTTETISPRYRDLDVWDNIDALKALYEGQLAAVAAVGPVLPALAAAVDDAAPRLRRGGRLIYVGAGTSARIGVQDGAELLPTFNWPADLVVFAIAGGEGALLRAVENAEDSAEAGAARMAEIGPRTDDVVIGLAASGETPFTIAAVKAARASGAMTMGVANNAGAALLAISEHPIPLQTGEEPIAGSTRLKAATAQKVVLNLFSTLLMVRLGRVHAGLMVQMRPTNEKLRGRSVHMVVAITGVDEESASDAVAKAGGDVKLATLLASGVSLEKARALLKTHDGVLRAALAEITPR